MFNGELRLPEEPILSGYDPKHILDELALDHSEVSSIVLNQSQRRVDLLWTPTGAQRKWWGLKETQAFRRRVYRSGADGETLIAVTEVEVKGEPKVPSAIRAFGTVYFLFNSSFAKTASHYLSLDLAPRSRSAVAWLLISLQHRLLSNKARKVGTEILDRFVNNIDESENYSWTDLDGVDLQPMYKMFETETWQLYDPGAWVRKKEPS
jgi:hypothetical protein